MLGRKFLAYAPLGRPSSAYGDLGRHGRAAGTRMRFAIMHRAGSSKSRRTSHAFQGAFGQFPQPAAVYHQIC